MVTAVNTLKKTRNQAAQSSTAQHTHSNFNTLENLTQQDLDDITLLKNKVASIASLFGIVFNSSGVIVSEDYTGHNHDYEDDNGTTIDIKTTGGVNP
jgi:hypothetical protein